jgi:Protein of unknown function with HXXEE motif
MEPGDRTAFLALIAAQAVHSVEEYLFRLYDVFAPARLISDLLGLDRAIGFVAFNAALLLFGLWCYLARVRPARHSGLGFVWFWAVLEIANGLGHIALAIAAGGYFPGVATAPLLLAIGGFLVLRLRGFPRR